MAFPIIYVDTAGNGGATTNSGSSDTSSPTVSGTGTASVSSTTVTFTGSPDLSMVPTDGSATIYIAGATNTNQNVFRITAVDNTAKTVTVDTAPTGSLTNVNWAIGGRQILPNTSLEGAVKAGWIVQVNNSLAAVASTYFTCRNAGNSTNGIITIRGKTGGRPTLNTTNTANVITANNQAGWRITNLTIDQDGASGNAMSIYTAWVVDNCRIIDGGADGINHVANSQCFIINCEITGVGGAGVNTLNNNSVLIGNYIHDVGTYGFTCNQANPVCVLLFNVFDTCGLQAIYLSSASVSFAVGPVIFGNTIYGCGNSGYEVGDVDAVGVLMNNIFAENGNASGEYNIDMPSGMAWTGYHANNIFFHSGGGGGANLNNFTADASDLTSDPQFANAAGGDFTIALTSPAKGAGFPGVLGINGGTGYLDIGALQRQLISGTARIIGG